MLHGFLVVFNSHISNSWIFVAFTRLQDDARAIAKYYDRGDGQIAIFDTYYQCQI